jgi:MFS family permease
VQPDAVVHRPAAFFYGWVIVALGGLVVFASAPGQSFVFSVFVDEVRSETGLSRTGISTLYAVGTVASAGMVLVTSRLAARFGTRRALLTAGVCLALACFAMYGARTAVALTVGFAALRALGQGSLTINTTVMAAQWFVLKRGRAMALMGLGYPLSIAVLPPVAKALVDFVGWRETYALLGVFVLVAIVPGAIFVARERPEDVGLYPDGADHPPESESRPTGRVSTPKVTSSRFWQLAVPLAIPSLLSTGLIFHQFAIMSERGLSASLAAQLFIPHAIALAAMSVFAGFLVDRLGPKISFAVGITLLVAAMLLLSLITVEPVAVAYSLLLGASEGTTRVVNLTAWAHYFGRTNIARLQGSAVMVVICGTALGPLPFAVLSGWLGGLTEASTALCLVALAALAAVLIYRPAATAVSPNSHDAGVPLV